MLVSRIFRLITGNSVPQFRLLFGARVCNMAEQLDLKLVLEANEVKDAGGLCQQLYEHGVTALNQFATLSNERLRDWGIVDYDDCGYDNVCDRALPHAQELLRNSTHDLTTIKQQLLVRVRMH